MSTTNHLHGKVCLVTGSTSGVGKVVALELARMGAGVVVVARDGERGEAAMSEIRAASGSRSVDLLLADLSSPSQVRRLAQQFRERYGQLHVLINNAGTIFPSRATTDEGLETTFAVNHLAPFLLTNLLLDRLTASAPARIVNLASAAHHGVLDFGWLRGIKPRPRLFPNWRAYNQSKLANILFTYELARRLAGTGVTVNCLHPGMVATSAGSASRGAAGLVLNHLRPVLVRFFLGLPRTFLLTPEQGAAALVFLASSPAVDGISGRYFVRTREARSSPRSSDVALARRLWRLDAELVGLDESSSEDHR